MSPPPEVATADAGVPAQPAEDARLSTTPTTGSASTTTRCPAGGARSSRLDRVRGRATGCTSTSSTGADSPEQRYAAALADYDVKKRAPRARRGRQRVRAAARAQQRRIRRSIAHGEALFKAKCASCHAEDGRGLIGPNLTDDRQIHGSTRMDLYTTIARGVPGTAMLAWSEQMPQPDVLAATAFVATLRGRTSRARNPRAPRSRRCSRSCHDAGRAHRPGAVDPQRGRDAPLDPPQARARPVLARRASSSATG